MRFRIPLACLAVLALAATSTTIAAAPASVAGPPGKWTRVTDTNGRSINEVGLARTADGVLHVVWQTESGADEAVMHTAVSPGGNVGGKVTVVDGLDSLSNPDLLVEPTGGLRTLFGATTGSNELDGIRTATATPDGASWTAQGSRASNSKQPDNVGAGVTSSGSPIFAWGITGSLLVHTGVNSSTADLDLNTESKCCYYDPDLATDSAGGETYAAWYSNADGEFGTWVQRVAPSLGERMFVPGSAKNGQALHPRNRTQIASRLGAPGVYVAYCNGYPVCKQARVWRVGSGKPMVAGRDGDVESVGLSAGPGGRLWVYWQDNDGDVYKATRSNEAATRFGAIVPVKPPKGTVSLWHVAGEGSRGNLDLLAHVSTGNSTATWHTQIKPGLTLSCKGGKVVSCTVSDAGDPVGGAKVKVGGKSVTANSKGKMSVNLPPGTFVARATRAGYTPASTRVKSK